MRVLRPLIGLALSLLLCFGSAAMAVSRSEALGTSQIEVCAAGQAVTLTLDAQGNPQKPRHPCPVCLAGVLATLAPGPAPAAPILVARPAARPMPPVPDAPRHVARPTFARGPPVPV